MPGAVGPGFRPPGGANAKPPAAALLTGQVARELASTLKRLRLVRSFHWPWPCRASCCTQVITALRESRFTALANGLELGFVVPRQALSGMGGDFSEPATRRFSISWLRHVDQIGAKMGTRTSITEVQSPKWDSRAITSMV